ncbi:MAG: valine--tRNA ligase [Oscillospiraceae bacterium]|jgi:valyl-tRNA synthetase|nr:valine--tRNA ligase [Oscillospiraceae bacterium]
MQKQLSKTYEPSEAEARIYADWERGGYFHAQIDSEKQPYTIVIPPPNITGQLHMGHALDNTLQDILIRWKRMMGYSALWLPGTDHASIATEAKIVARMKEEGLTKEDLGREGFLKRAWEWKEVYGGRIIQQLKKLGSSCDWERERFTLDEGCNRAVNTVFVRLYEKGLIYRGERMINWCPHCLTSISDAEVEYTEKEGHFWHLRYPFSDGSGDIQVATTRPETMLGDTAVAVNPEDERYTAFIGKTVILPLVGREIPIIADSYVEKDFGTGAVKITPAHDPNDFEVGIRHGLPVINVMTEEAVINENGGKYAGLSRFDARKSVLADLDAGGFLLKTEPMKHNVGVCYRCQTVVEPLISKQWFVKMAPLAAPAVEAVKKGETRFVPERFGKIYLHWMENIRDWCISRQLWWGHRIPAYYCGCGEVIVSARKITGCPKCGGKVTRDPDTLDTWFSSALWPFSTLGWPENTEDFNYFYPTDTLVTMYDIIFFWVARMIFSGLEHTGQVPFKTVFIHGMMRDELGRKMSKSLGNGPDPLEEIEKYGADALRFSLVTGNSPGNDMRYYAEKVEASRNFANKLWNAARFILMNLGENPPPPYLPDDLRIEDKWVLSKFNRVAGEINENLEKFELGLAVEKIHNFAWDVFCDWYIEVSKTRLREDGQAVENVAAVLVWVMNGIARLLHPFMPFITEEIWQTLPHTGETVMLAPYPQFDPALDFSAAEQNFERIMAAIQAIRNLRAEMKVPPSKKAHVTIATEFGELFEACAPYITRLASASGVTVAKSFSGEGYARAVTPDAVAYLPVDELCDPAAETARLQKELDSARAQLATVNAKLQNESFTQKAPPTVVENQRETAKRLEQVIKKAQEALNSLGSSV